LADLFTAAGVATPIKFTGQVGADTNHALTLRSIDVAGNVSESTMILVVPPIDGAAAGPRPPAISLAWVGPGLTRIQMQVTAPATRIHYFVQYPRKSTPPTVWSTHVGTTKQLQITSTVMVRVWCRSSDGANHSGWVYGDFAAMG
jgi:hypothetical protein